jgi:hypothetical protein
MVHYPKRKNFLERPRRRRKELFIGVKNRIREYAPILGGLFETQDYMHGRNAWIDCNFLSKSRSVVFYNCTLETTRYRYKELVEHEAWENAEKLLPRRSSALDFTKAGQALFDNDMHSPRTEFGGLTRAEFWQAEERKIADSLFFEVYEEVSLHFDYACGVGLHATLDVPYLTIDAVNQFIRRFHQHEFAYKNTTPLKYTYDEVGRWGVEANAIVEAKDYALVPPTSDIEASSGSDDNR